MAATLAPLPVFHAGPASVAKDAMLSATTYSQSPTPRDESTREPHRSVPPRERLGLTGPPRASAEHVGEPAGHLTGQPGCKQQRCDTDTHDERPPVHLTHAIEQEEGHGDGESERGEVELEGEAEEDRG